MRRGQPPCPVEREAAQRQGSRRLVQPLVIARVMAWCDVLLLLLLWGTDSCQNLGEHRPAWHGGVCSGLPPDQGAALWGGKEGPAGWVWGTGAARPRSQQRKAMLILKVKMRNALKG